MTATESGGALPLEAQAPGLSPLARARAILGGSAGNLVEWYDWFAYSAFTLYFAHHFFPKGDQTSQLLQAAAVFAVGFLARPVGAWIMGLYADRVGRKAALALSVALMSLGSFAISITPGYDVIGVWAPVLLTVARLVQGLSVGGEYGASATYLSEMAGRKRRGFWSSFQYLTLIAGQLCATVVLLVLQHTLAKGDLDAWGWRIPFAIGGLLAIVVFWIRSGLDETTSYAKVGEDQRARLDPRHLRWILGLLAVALAACALVFRSGDPNALSISVAILVIWQLSLVVPLLMRHPREVLAVVGLTAAGSLSFYAYTTYMPKFLVNTALLGKDTATAISAGSLLIYAAVQPAFGALSDKIGRKPALAYTFGLGALLTYPIFATLAHTHAIGPAFLLVTALVLIHSGYSSVSAVVKAELFPTHVRALGVALPYAIGNTVFGGTAEYVALWFKQQKIEAGFYAYVAAIMAVALVIALRLRDTGRDSAILED